MFYELSIDPIFFKMANFKIYWYGILYLTGILLVYILIQINLSNYTHKKRISQIISNISLYIIIGILIGARIGYIIFYNFTYYYYNPLSIFKTWEGGLSFHGGLIGGILSIFIYCLMKKEIKNFFYITDFLAIFIPIGIFVGRIGNFINGELYGKATNIFWGVIFKTDPLKIPRHPTQIYEAILEGIILSIILKIYNKNGKREKMCTSGLSLILYGIFRFLIEFIRLPDKHIGYFYNLLTLGQILTIPMIIIGLIVVIIGILKSKNQI